MSIRIAGLIFLFYGVTIGRVAKLHHRRRGRERQGHVPQSRPVSGTYSRAVCGHVLGQPPPRRGHYGVLVSTHALSPNGNWNTALRVNTRRYQPSTTVEDLVAEGIAWGLEEQHARAAVTGPLERLASAPESADGSAAGEKVVNYITHGTRNLWTAKCRSRRSPPVPGTAGPERCR